MGHNFPWEYQARVANPWENNNEHFYFVHRLYERFSPVSSFMEPLDDYLIKVLNVKSIIRARVLLYPNQGKFIEHDPHVDFEYSPMQHCYILMTTMDIPRWKTELR